MKTELSQKMISAIYHMSRHSNKLVRFPGGYWARDGWHSWDGPCWGTPTVEAIVRRGFAEYTVWKDGRSGRFPIECGLTKRALDWLTPSESESNLAQPANQAVRRHAEIEGKMNCSCGKSAIEHESIQLLAYHHYWFFHKEAIPECPYCNP